MCVYIYVGSQIFLHKFIKQNWPPSWHTLIYTNLMHLSGFFFLKVKKREREPCTAWKLFVNFLTVARF